MDPRKPGKIEAPFNVLHKIHSYFKKPQIGIQRSLTPESGMHRIGRWVSWGAATDTSLRRELPKRWDGNTENWTNQGFMEEEDKYLLIFESKRFMGFSVSFPSVLEFLGHSFAPTPMLHTHSSRASALQQMIAIGL